MLRRFFAIPLWQRTAAGFVLGILAGLILREQAPVWLQPIGDVYLNLIRMVVAPLVPVSYTHLTLPTICSV